MRRIDPPVKRLNSSEAIKNWSDTFSPLFIASSVGKSAAFEAVAAIHREDAVFVTAPVEGVQVYRKDEGLAATLTDLSTQRSIEDFVALETIPLVGQIASDNYKNYLAQSKPLVWFVGSDSDLNAMIAPLRKASKHFRNDARFVSLLMDRYKEQAWSKAHNEGAMRLCCSVSRGR